MFAMCVLSDHSKLIYHILFLFGNACCFVKMIAFVWVWCYRSILFTQIVLFICFPWQWVISYIIHVYMYVNFDHVQLLKVFMMNASRRLSFPTFFLQNPLSHSSFCSAIKYFIVLYQAMQLYSCLVFSFAETDALNTYYKNLLLYLI